MTDKTISSLATVAYKPTLLVPAVDLTLASGSRNVVVLASSLQPSSITSLSQLSDAADLTGTAGQFVGFDSSNAPTAFSKATAQANLSVAKATLTFFLNSVVNGTYTLIQQLPASFTINSVDTNVQFGSFVVSSLNISGTPILGLSNLAVSLASNTNTLATGSNVGAAGATITLIITGVNQGVGGVVSLNLTRN